MYLDITLRCHVSHHNFFKTVPQLWFKSKISFFSLSILFSTFFYLSPSAHKLYLIYLLPEYYFIVDSLDFDLRSFQRTQDGSVVEFLPAIQEGQKIMKSQGSSHYNVTLSKIRVFVDVISYVSQD